MLDVDALDGADTIGEVENLWLAEGLGGEPAAVGLPDNRRVETLLDGGPDGERRRKLVAVDGQVRPVPGAELVDAGEQVVGGVSREHVGEPGFHPDADEREPPGGAPLVFDANWSSPSLTPVWLYGCSGWRCDRLMAMSR